MKKINNFSIICIILFFVCIVCMTFLPDSHQQNQNLTISQIVSLRGGSFKPFVYIDYDSLRKSAIEMKEVNEITEFLNQLEINEQKIRIPKVDSNLEEEEKIKIFRETLVRRFPDWEDRVNYEKKQSQLAHAAKTKLWEAKQARILFKLTPEELDAIDYFSGKGFYESKQHLSALPNIYDTRQSFLRKMEDAEMRERFLKFYQKQQKEISP